MIEIKNLTKKYGEKVIYENFNLNLEENKITVILGESGSGKTTLFNVLIGLSDYSGEVSGIEKPLSVIFQQDRLVKNLTVEDNLKLVYPDINVSDALESVRLNGYEKRYPKTLSAGQARRVNIVRGLNFPSETLLMDEPFINIDVAVKYAIMDKIKGEQNKTPKTVLMITHDVGEAVYLADRIVVINRGKIIYDKLNEKEKSEKELFGLLMNIHK